MGKPQYETKTIVLKKQMDEDDARKIVEARLIGSQKNAGLLRIDTVRKKIL